MIDDLDKQIQIRCKESLEFRAAYEAERALLALVRARQEANLSQKDVADALHVSQPYIAQIENGSRKPGYLLLFKYASIVGATIGVSAQPQR